MILHTELQSKLLYFIVQTVSALPLGSSGWCLWPLDVPHPFGFEHFLLSGTTVFPLPQPQKQPILEKTLGLCQFLLNHLLRLRRHDYRLARVFTICCVFDSRVYSDHRDWCKLVPGSRPGALRAAPRLRPGGGGSTATTHAGLGAAASCGAFTARV